MKKLKIWVLIMVMICSSWSAIGCVKNDDAKKVVEYQNDKNSSSDDDSVNDDESSHITSEQETTPMDESDSTTGTDETKDSSDSSVATDTEPTADDTTKPTESSSKNDTEETTTKNNKTEATTTKPVATTEPTTAKPTTTTTKQEVTTEEPTTKPVNYGAVVNPLTDEHLEKYSRRDVSDAAKSAAETIIKNNLKTTMSEVERVKAIHDWLVKNVTYNSAAADNIAGNANVDNSALTAEGCLIGKNVVCEGYSEGFLLLCWTAGIEARIVTGDATNESGTQGHEWNVVKLDGKWYQVDVTWDDPFMNGSTSYTDGYNLRYKYFLITTNDMKKDHTIEEFWNSEDISCTSTDYYSMVDAWAIANKVGNIPFTKVTTYEEVKTATTNYLSKGVTVFALVYTSESLNYQSVMNNAQTAYGSYLKTATHPAGYKGYSYGAGITHNNDRGYSIDEITLTVTYKY